MEDLEKSLLIVWNWINISFHQNEMIFIKKWSKSVLCNKFFLVEYVDICYMVNVKKEAVDNRFC